MKKIKLFALFICLSIIIGTVVCLADDAVPYSSQSIATAENKVSFGLDVIANRCKTEMAGLSGLPLSFSADKFACAMNLSRVSSITVVSLPDSNKGRLYLGSNAVEVGDVIYERDIERLSYEEETGGVGKQASFKYRVNSGGYDVECVIYMLDKINASPTVEVASFASLNILTYKGISVGGVLAAHDPEGDELTYEIAKYPSDGRLVLEDIHTGIYSYTPDSSFTGKDEFVYVVKDKYGNYSSGIKVNIEVDSPSVSVKYNDLEGTDVYNYAINMTELGIMNGERVGDNYYFRPEGEVSRIDFLVSAMKALGITSVPSAASTPFADDESIGAEQKGYVNLAYAKGYISGIKDGDAVCFCPDDKITLNEASVIISNMIGYASPEIIPTFNDMDKVSAWSERAVLSLHALGIIECFDNSIRANENLSRGDMARMLSKAVLVMNNI